jgi:hypothetical protein
MFLPEAQFFAYLTESADFFFATLLLKEKAATQVTVLAPK